MPLGFFLFRRYSPGKIERTGRYSHAHPARSNNPVYEAGESTRHITAEYSMVYPDLLS